MSVAECCRGRRMKFVVFIIIAVLTALVLNVRFVGSDNKKYVPYYMPYFVQPRRSTDIYTIGL